MAAFSPAFSPTGFYAGAAADVTTELTRVAAEVVGTFPENSVSRIVAEVMMAPELAHGVVSRAVLEVLQSAPPYVATVSRAVVEVLQEHTYIPPLPTAELHRIVLEVLGTAADFVGKRVTASRTAVEALGSATRRSVGLSFAPVALPAYTLMLVMDPGDASDGEFTVASGPWNGATVTLAGSEVIVGVGEPGNSLVGSSTRPTGPFRVAITTGSGGKVYLNGIDITLSAAQPGLNARHLGYETTYALPGKGTVKELMLWDRALTDDERYAVDTYLDCKWFQTGCDVTELDCEPAS